MDKTNRKYTNGEITVFWQPRKCIHATTCYRELIEVFNPRKRPWVDMNGAPTNEIIRVVKLCPTQALSYEYNSDIENEKQIDSGSNAEIDAEVRIMEDGPMVLKGDFTIYDESGSELKKMKITSLCRCGRSGEMPFCDGNHRKTGYKGK